MFLTVGLGNNESIQHWRVLVTVKGRYFSIVLQPTSVCECVHSSWTGPHLHGNDALAAVVQAIVLICSLSVLI